MMSSTTPTTKTEECDATTAMAVLIPVDTTTVAASPSPTTNISSSTSPASVANRFGRRDSLIKQASLDREQNEGLRRQNTLRRRKELEQSLLTASSLPKPLLERLNDDSVELIKNANEDCPLDLLLILHCGGGEDCCRDILQISLQHFYQIGLHLTYLETRPDFASSPSYNSGEELQMRAKLSGKKSLFLEALSKLVVLFEKSIERIELRHNKLPTISTTAIEVVEDGGNCKWSGERELVEKLDEGGERGGGGDVWNCSNNFSLVAWFPTHISELDKCAHVVVKYEPTADPKHPGFGDKRYIDRRAELNTLANTFHFGAPIPLVEYTQEEHGTWKAAYEQLKELRETHTCKEYQQNIEEMERVGLITANQIPQLRDLSAYIQRKTGFELRPCGGLLSARDFLASLAFRVFQATLYVRHSSAPHHCPEPDVIHEVLGHCPMFVDENLAQLSQDIGLLSLGASDEQIERLATVYWFIIEFGLCKQKGKLCAIGAGLLSAYGELKFACSNEPGHEPFKPEVTALRNYVDSDYQPVYFVADSIEKALEDVRTFAHSMCAHHTNLYNSFTRTVKRMSNKQMLELKATQLKKKCEELCKTVAKMNSSVGGGGRENVEEENGKKKIVDEENVVEENDLESEKGEGKEN